MADEARVLMQAKRAIRGADKAGARRILKPLLQEKPTAEAWYIAAQSMDSEAQAITCLKKALVLDEWHVQANRLLLKLEGAPSLEEVARKRETQNATTVSTDSVAPLPDLKRKPRVKKVDSARRRRRMWTRVGCVSFMVMSFACSVFTFSLIDLVPGVIGAFIQFTGGPPPITELDGRPIEEVENAAYFIEPALSEDATSQQVNVLEHGYVHEYRFSGRVGEDYAIYVQFMSVAASDVDANTLVLDPDGNVVGRDVCLPLGEAGLLGGQGNVTINCSLNRTGEWRMRVLGINGESVGAYFAAIERLDGRSF